jgi:hypothetical protein
MNIQKKVDEFFENLKDGFTEDSIQKLKKSKFFVEKLTESFQEILNSKSNES